MDNFKAMIFNDVDVYRCNNYMYKYGLNKDLSFAEVIKIAKEHGCNGIAKHGRGKYYLRKFTRTQLINRINTKNCYYKNVIFMII